MPTNTSSADIDKATLKLFISSVGSPGNLTVRRVNTGWAEATIPVGGIAPVLDTVTPAKTFNIKTGFARRWVELDVTDLVKGWVDTPTSNKGLALTVEGASSLDAVIDSKESTATSHQALLDVVLKLAAGPTGGNGC